MANEIAPPTRQLRRSGERTEPDPNFGFKYSFNVLTRPVRGQFSSLIPLIFENCPLTGLVSTLKLYLKPKFGSGSVLSPDRLNCLVGGAISLAIYYLRAISSAKEKVSAPQEFF